LTHLSILAQKPLAATYLSRILLLSGKTIARGASQGSLAGADRTTQIASLPKGALSARIRSKVKNGETGNTELEKLHDRSMG